MHEEPLQTRKDLGILNAVAYCFYLCGAHSIFTPEMHGTLVRLLQKLPGETLEHQGAPETLGLSCIPCHLLFCSKVLGYVTVLTQGTSHPSRGLQRRMSGQRTFRAGERQGVTAMGGVNLLLPHRRSALRSGGAKPYDHCWALVL